MVADVFSLLLLTFLWGLVGVIWLAGVSRWLSGLGARLQLGLWSTAIVLPLCGATWTYVALDEPGSWVLVRVSTWVETIGRLWLLKWVLICLWCGTLAITVVQEVLPLLRRNRRRWFLRGLTSDARLEQCAARVREAVLRRHPVVARAASDWHWLRVHVVAVDVPLVALHGVWRPRLIASRELLRRLDDDELFAVVAHEFGHLVTGGGLRMLLLWGCRLLQAFNPATLIAFRELVEARERACDSVALSLCGTPEPLVSAMSKMGESVEPATLAERAEATSIGVRSRMLLANRLPPKPGHIVARGGACLGFTATLLLALWGADRVVLGPITPVGWVEAQSVAQVPAQLGRISIPAYFPQALRWPPVRVYYQLLPARGWWLFSAAHDDSRTQIWIGASGTATGPAAMAPVAGCLAKGTAVCPRHWRHISIRRADQAVIHVVTNLPRREALRIAEGLRR